MCIGIWGTGPFEYMPGAGIIIIPPGCTPDATLIGAAPLELAVTDAALAGL